MDCTADTNANVPVPPGWLTERRACQRRSDDHEPDRAKPGCSRRVDHEHCRDTHERRRDRLHDRSKRRRTREGHRENTIDDRGALLVTREHSMHCDDRRAKSSYPDEPCGERGVCGYATGDEHRPPAPVSATVATSSPPMVWISPREPIASATTVMSAAQPATARADGATTSPRAPRMTAPLRSATNLVRAERPRAARNLGPR